MPQQLKYVGQMAMDQFYQQYKGDEDFWELEDFISMCGNTIASIYLTFYQQEYAMLRADRNTDGISFDAGWLLEQEATVEKKGNKLLAILDKPVMTFPYDKSSIGVQNVFISDPETSDELERSSISTLWQLNYIPKTNRIFFYSDVSAAKCDVISSLGFVNKGNCNIKKVRVLYVPTMVDENANVPDGIIGDAIIKTVLAMRQIETGNVVDQTANQNSNKILQTELDKNTLIGR